MRDDHEMRSERVEQALTELGNALRDVPPGEGPLDLDPHRGALPPVLDPANTAVEAELELIARRVRRWRDASNLTLQELARRSGVAASTIQKIETQQMIPTIAVLLKIAHGLDRPAADLVRDDADEHRVVCLRAGERHSVGLHERMRMERLVGDLFEPHLEVWRVTHDPGSGSGRRRIRFEGESLIVCERGKVTFYVGEQEFVLSAGDTLHFKSSLPHGWHNKGEETASFLSIGTLPRVLRARLHQRLRDFDADALPDPV